MRSARVGDALTHDQLTGETTPPGMEMVMEISGEEQQLLSSEDVSEIIPDGSDLITPLHVMPEALELPSENLIEGWGDEPGLLAGGLATSPTSVYEGPAWTGRQRPSSSDGAPTAAHQAVGAFGAPTAAGAPVTSSEIEQLHLTELPEPTLVGAIPVPPPVPAYRSLPLRAALPPPVDMADRRTPARAVMFALDAAGPDTTRVRPVEVQEESAHEIFAQTLAPTVHESIIIDFERGEPTKQSSEPSKPPASDEVTRPAPISKTIPVPPQAPAPRFVETSSIRPAAQPLGKRVVPAIATARPRPRGADDLPTPPPTPRRR